MPQTMLDSTVTNRPLPRALTIDPRYHDGVIFELEGVVVDTARADTPVVDSTIALVHKLHEAGVRTAAYSSGRDCEHVLASVGDVFTACVAGFGHPGPPNESDSSLLLNVAMELRARPERCVVVACSEAGLSAGRYDGFALVIAVSPMTHADRTHPGGADVVLHDLADVVVRCGTRRISTLPGCVRSACVIGLTAITSANPS
jgi:alpha,alpha-trehalase